MPAPSYASAETEYWRNVMRQQDMPLAGEITFDFDVPGLRRTLADVAAVAEADAMPVVARTLRERPASFHDLRRLLGLTDKRAYLELSYLASRTPHPSQDTGLCGCQPWNMARHGLPVFLRMLEAPSPRPVRRAASELLARYLLAEGLHTAATSFHAIPEQGLRHVFETLVAARETQQRAAKRRGHGCELRLATVLHACGATCLPEDKHTNPMGSHDPHLDLDTLRVVPRRRGVTYSFDLLVLHQGAPRVAIQSLIHTSDPGQYGVNKSDETVAVKARIAASRRRLQRGPELELWGLLDGVGFSENKEDTLNKMLANFDHFLQLNTLYKAPLRLHRLGLCEVVALRLSSAYTPDEHDAIVERYAPEGVAVLRGDAAAPANAVEVPAGLGAVYVPASGSRRAGAGGRARRST